MTKKRKSQIARDASTKSPELASPEQPGVVPVSDSSASPDIGTLVRLAVQETVTIHAGPLPPPEILREYDQALPGLADRIVSMAEGQANHRQHLDVREQRSVNRLQTVGQASGVAMVLAALVLVFLEKPGAPMVAITAIAALAGVFVFSKYRSAVQRVGKSRSPSSANVPEP